MSKKSTRIGHNNHIESVVSDAREKETLHFSKTHQDAFEVWWESEIAGIAPDHGKMNLDDFIKRITMIAWINGADTEARR